MVVFCVCLFVFCVCVCGFSWGCLVKSRAYRGLFRLFSGLGFRVTFWIVFGFRV